MTYHIFFMRPLRDITPYKLERKNGIQKITTVITLLSLLLWSSALLADRTLLGRVVSIADGDTLTLLDEHKNQHKIRLAGIDTPERHQPFYERAKQNLAKNVMHKDVEVRWAKRDRYGRVIGKVIHKGVDINLLQVTEGLAWHYKYYQSEQSPEDREKYTLAEDSARSENLGLWTDKNPTPPWDFRKQGRKYPKN